MFAFDASAFFWSEEGFNFRIYEKGNPKAIYQADSKKGSMQKDLAFIMASDKKVVKNFLKSISSPKTLVFHYNENGKEYSYELPEEDKEYLRRTAQTYLELVEHFKK